LQEYFDWEFIKTPLVYTTILFLIFLFIIRKYIISQTLIIKSIWDLLFTVLVILFIIYFLSIEIFNLLSSKEKTKEIIDNIKLVNSIKDFLHFISFISTFIPFFKGVNIVIRIAIFIGGIGGYLLFNNLVLEKFKESIKVNLKNILIYSSIELLFLLCLLGILKF